MWPFRRAARAGNEAETRRWEAGKVRPGQRVVSTAMIPPRPDAPPPPPPPSGHGDRWSLRQALAAPGRYYGDGGTIHGSTWLDVEVDDDGQVVAVWFRCQMLPWRVFRRSSGDGRYGPQDLSPCQLTGVEVRDAAG